MFDSTNMRCDGAAVPGVRGVLAAGILPDIQRGIDNNICHNLQVQHKTGQGYCQIIQQVPYPDSRPVDTGSGGSAGAGGDSGIH